MLGSPLFPYERSDVPEHKRILFPCCFCGEVEPQADHGLALVERDTGEFEQQWWCHVRCLLEQMVPEAASAYAAEFPE